MRGMRLNHHKVTHLGIVPTTTTLTTRTLSPLSLSLASSSSLPVTHHQQAHQKFHSCVHHSYAKKKSVYNHNNKVRKPSPKTQNVIHLQYDPRVDETPKKQEFIQKLQEKDRERIQQLIMQFDQIASASRILHTEIMSDVLKALRQFGNTTNEQQPKHENKEQQELLQPKAQAQEAHIDQYVHMFSKQCLISDENFLQNLKHVLRTNEFLTEDASSEELARYVQALIDPSFLVNAVKDISMNAIKHFSNSELKSFGTSLFDTLIRDYIIRFSVAQTATTKASTNASTGARATQASGDIDRTSQESPVESTTAMTHTVAAAAADNNSNNGLQLVQIQENQVLPALTDLPSIPLTKQEIISIEKPLRNLNTLRHVLNELGLSQFVRFVPFSQVYDPDHFHGLSEEKSTEQIETAAHANVLRSLLGVYFMHHGMERTWELFNRRIVPLAIDQVQQDNESKDFTHYPNMLKKFLLQQTKYEPEYRYIDVRAELQMSEALYSRKREKMLREIDMQKEMDRSVYKANVVAGVVQSESDKDEQMHALIQYPDKYKLICVGLYVNNHLLGRAFSESYTQAKHRVARQVYEDLTSSTLTMKKLRDKLVNTEYVRSVSKIAKVSKFNLAKDDEQ